MNGFAPLVILAATVALAVAACTAAPTRPASDADSASLTPANETPATPAASGWPVLESPSACASPGVRLWGAGSGSSFAYGSLAQWGADLADNGGGVALVRVVDISPVQWSTASGAAPSAADLERASRAEIEFTIGRLVSAERVRVLGGAWPLSGARASYWLPGGRLVCDRTPEGIDFGLSPPRVGGLAVAGMFAGTDLDPTPGELTVNVQQLFPADPSGRVRTFDPTEQVTLDSVAAAVAGP